MGRVSCVQANMQAGRLVMDDDMRHQLNGEVETSGEQGTRAALHPAMIERHWKGRYAVCAVSWLTSADQKGLCE